MRRCLRVAAAVLIFLLAGRLTACARSVVSVTAGTLSDPLYGSI